MKSEIKLEEKKEFSIGILTFHFSNHNFGAVLQTYASFSILKYLGFSPVIINLVPKRSGSIISQYKSFVLSYFNGSNNFKKFRRKHLVLTKKIYSSSNLEKLNQKFNIFYVGSDQVWRKTMAKERLTHYFLDFASEDKLKISYAASFGISQWEGNDKETKVIKSLLNQFSHVSVRERDGIKICNETFNIKASLVLDPTLLLNDEDYSKILPKNSNKIEKGNNYVGLYLITDHQCKGSIPQAVKQQTGLPTFNLYGNNMKLLNRTIFQFRKVEDWLLGIKNASLVITDSYHCMIFSIIFKKDFICLSNERGGVSRIKSLLSFLGLEDRYCDKTNPDYSYYALNNINYNEIINKLEYKKAESMKFLKKALMI